ncbi:Helicase associated domain protein [Cryobacterium tagatosivorans]|uniref:Helicase-associated domain-containing protein n=1 Tax=Cryobacterium tagatosivorans TaxID=1259199 RepID=A0A4R8UL56_9MICO|nr:Helicase associated domain protein [Cryobacterium tagatosivorans]TFB56754.1 hypothetical protein E3O23_00620 [Cryobacterium tagatosivorans]
MSPSAAVQALHQFYTELSQRGSRSQTGDEVLSLRFYRTDLAVFADPHAFVGRREQVARWTLNTHDLEAFVAREDRIPRQNNRARERISDEEWRLAGWLADERAAIRTGCRCAYQAERLLCIPGVSLNPLGDLWDAQFEKYRRFIDIHRRAPLERSDDESEGRLAGWAAKQRLYYRAGTLPPHRAEALSGLEFWTWGKSR